MNEQQIQLNGLLQLFMHIKKRMQNQLHLNQFRRNT